MGKDKKEKKDVLDADEKAAKKAAKKAKREAEEGAAASPEVDDKAAKKAAKKAKKEAEEAATAGGSPVDEKAAKKAAKKAKREAEEAAAGADAPPAKKVKTEDGELSKDEKKAKKKAEKEPAEAGEAAPAPAAPAAAPAEGGELNRVYVANLPFSVNNEVDWLKDEFKSAGVVTSIDFMSHADTGRFKGSCFMTFATAAEATAATAMNGKELEGRPMKIEIAMPKKAPPPGGIGGSGDPGEPSESIFVGNLSWSITEDALKGAFADCGEIARIKWLEKDGEFKGIAFVDFYDVESATKAVAKAGTDVAGRPLRINFSKKKEGGAGGDKWGSAAGGRVERAYKPAGPKPDGCTELFCGNLPWSIDEEKIKTFFGGVGASVSGLRPAPTAPHRLPPRRLVLPAPPRRAGAGRSSLRCCGGCD